MSEKKLRIAGGQVYAATIAALCGELGITNTTYQDWRRAGCPDKESAGYPLSKIFRWYRLRESSRQSAKTAGDEAKAAELLKAKSEAKLKYLKLQEAEGQLLPREQVHRGLSLIAARLKSRLEDIERAHPDAGEILREALDDLEREVRDQFAGG